MGTWTSITKVGATSWQFTPGGTAPWYEWLDGLVVRANTSETPTIYEGTDTQEPPAVELLTSTETYTAYSAAYPPAITLQWRGSTAAQAYIIQEYTSSAWATYDTITEIGRGYYQYTTPAQVDGTTAKWRVQIADINGTIGTGVESDVNIVCNPAPPSISGTYSSSGGTLTIAVR